MRVLGRGALACLLLLGLAFAEARAAGVRFSGPPTIGDRKISWQWEPLQDKDPFFQGNTVLDLIGTVASPVPPPVRILKANADGSRLYGVGADNRIYIWKSGTSVAEKVLDAPPDSLLDFDVHQSGNLIIGGLRDGRIAYWDLPTSNAPALFNGQDHACRFIRFLVRTPDVTERRYVTAGDEDTVRTWEFPGGIWRKIVTPGNTVSSLEVTDNGAFLVLGDFRGAIRIFQPLIAGPIVDSKTEHQGAIKSMIFTDDRRTLITIDTLGKVNVWSTLHWTVNFSLQLDRQEAAYLGLRDPDGALAYTLDRTGFYQVFDGRDGRRYRAANLIDSGEIGATVFADGGRQVYFALVDGSIRNYQTGFCQPSEQQPTCFGGYMLWRSPTPRAEDATMLRVYGFGDSTWTFVGGGRSFTDPDSLIPRSSHSEEPLAGPHNGLPFYYSLTPFERRFLNGGVFDVLLSTIDEGFYREDSLGAPTPVTAHAAAREDRPYLSSVIVIPNPYEAGKVPWDQEAGEHIEFRNLPSQATIKIFTMAGEQVRTIEHGAGGFGESTDTRRWDLRNDRGERVTSGVYIYHITTRLNGESTTGYLCLVR
jgi:hypothetical protein